MFFFCFLLQCIRVYYISLLTHNVIADVSFHIVGFLVYVGAVSIFGKKSEVVCGFFGAFLCGFAVF